jgi:hypothetical protein
MQSKKFASPRLGIDHQNDNVEQSVKNLPTPTPPRNCKG